MTKKELKKTSISEKTEIVINIEEEILDAERVAVILNSSKKVVERELREGQLVGHKRLSKWFVLMSDLIAYIKSGTP